LRVDSSHQVIVDAIDSSLAANNSNVDNLSIQAIMPIISQPDHELINNMESNISLVCLKSKDDANVPKEQAAQTKGYFSDAEPMREANPFFFSNFFTICKEFSQVLSTASIFKNADCTQKSNLNPTRRNQIHLK